MARKIRKAREQVAALIGAMPEEIIFTSCGSESDSSAVRSALATETGRRHIVTSRVEHPAIKALCSHLSNKGYLVTEIPVDGKGVLDMERYRESLTPDTRHCEHHVGQQRDRCHLSGGRGRSHGKGKRHTVSFRRGSDYRENAVRHVKEQHRHALRLRPQAACSKGASAYSTCARAQSFPPFLIGGHQEKGRRGGTENTASIIGLGKACELALRNMDTENREVKSLRDRLESELLKRIPNSHVNGDISNRLPNTSNISFESIEGESILPHDG